MAYSMGFVYDIGGGTYRLLFFCSKNISLIRKEVVKMENNTYTVVYDDNGCRDACVNRTNAEYEGRDPEYYEWN